MQLPVVPIAIIGGSVLALRGVLVMLVEPSAVDEVEIIVVAANENASVGVVTPAVDMIIQGIGIVQRVMSWI